MKGPSGIAKDICECGISKSQLKIGKMFILAVLAGAYIGFGALLMTTVKVGLAEKLGSGFANFVGGACFSVGLMLVVIGGAELFTGNCLMINSYCSKKIDVKGILRNWGVVYLGNLVGSIILVLIVFFGFYAFREPGEVGNLAIKIADSKVNLNFLEAMLRGIGCNWLVCLAVWLATSADDTSGKVWSIFFPIMTFVAIGFEHSVANMYFIPQGLFLKYIAGLSASANLTVDGFFLNNLLPVTIGNIIGGSFFVGILYYYAYLKK